MKTLSIAVAVLLVPAVLCAQREAAESGEHSLRAAQVPAAVRDAFRHAWPHATARGYSTEMENGRRIYEVESREGRVGRDVSFAADGTLLEVEETVAVAALPDAVRTALTARANGAAVAKAERVVAGTDTTYEFRITGQHGELELTPAGELVAPYHVARNVRLGGDGGWDYIALDTVGHRLFIARQDRVMVVDPDSGRLIAEIPGLVGAHGVAFAYAQGRGFATSGRDSTVIMFDLHTLAVLGRITAAVDDDAILFDPATGHVFTMNGDAGSSMIIDPATGTTIGTIPLGGKPEFGVSAGDGKLYANIEDSSQVVEIDAQAGRVIRRWSIAPCTSPSGLAIDREHHRLFSVCRNGMMGISDATRGTLITTMPIGQGVDAARFDPATGFAFASNGGGSITIVHEDDPDHYSAAGTVTTRPGARTMELDLATHRLYTVTAEFGPAPAPAPGARRMRPPVLPGTFQLIVLER